MHEPERFAVYEGNQCFDGLPDFGAGAFAMTITASCLGVAYAVTETFSFLKGNP